MFCKACVDLRYFPVVMRANFCRRYKYTRESMLFLYFIVTEDSSWLRPRDSVAIQNCRIRQYLKTSRDRSKAKKKHDDHVDVYQSAVFTVVQASNTASRHNGIFVVLPLPCKDV